MTDLEKHLAQQQYFRQQGGLQSTESRIKAIQRLQKVLKHDGHLLIDALAADIGKGAVESMTTELFGLQTEAKNLIRLLKKDARRKNRQLLLEPVFWPAVGEIQQEPYGTVLILSPWNYPVQLAFMPLLAALAGGNTVILRTSSKTPRTAQAIQQVVTKALPAEMVYVAPSETDPERLTDLAVDYIFFTGSVATGKRIATKAAKRLIPTTLELGGKSPAIVTRDADLALAAKRILFGKIMNAGQTCVAPDYVLADAAIADALVRQLARTVRTLLPQGVMTPDYPRLVADNAPERLQKMIDEGPVAFGGYFSSDGKKLVPTGIYPAHARLYAMQEEIFGPVLPILPYHYLSNALRYIKSAHPNPLALYVFTENKALARTILAQTPSGTAAVNDTLLQVASGKLPFGGRGTSGWGKYHGKASFNNLQHPKSVFWQSTSVDPAIRYMPWPKQMAYFLKPLAASGLHKS